MADIIELFQSPALDHPVRLFSGEQEVARLTLLETDYPAIKYEFVPLEGWFRLGPATEDLSLSLRLGMEGVERRVKAIDELDLRLVSDDLAIDVKDFLIRVHGDVATVRSIREAFPLGHRARPR